MSAKDDTERVLRNLHVLLSQSEPYEKGSTKVVVDKQKMLDLLSELNKNIYDIMDEYELTKQSRDKAQREFQKRGDQIVWDASRKAEDIYAASVMYTDEALNHIHEIMLEADAHVKAIYEEMDQKLKEEEQLVKDNQSELKSQLQDLVDTEKYLKLIENRNHEIQKEKEKKEGKPQTKEPSIYANRQTEIRVNTEVLEKLGMAPEEEEVDPEEEAKEQEKKLQEDLDADYFQWKDQEEEESQKKEEGGLGQFIKNLTGKGENR